MNKRIRELFESVSAPSFGHELIFPRNSKGEYIDPRLEDHWQTFQEGIESAVKECVSLLESERDMCAATGTYESREYYERMAAKEDAFNDAVSTIKYHFGVKE